MIFLMYLVYMNANEALVLGQLAVVFEVSLFCFSYYRWVTLKVFVPECEMVLREVGSQRCVKVYI